MACVVAGCTGRVVAQVYLGWTEWPSTSGRLVSYPVCKVHREELRRQLLAWRDGDRRVAPSTTAVIGYAEDAETLGPARRAPVSTEAEQ